MNSSESHQNERHANHANQAYQAYYDKFLHFVKEHAHKERQTVNRRLFSVLFWCFLIPTFLVIALSLLVEMNVLSWRFKNYLDWIILIFPVTYLLYYLSAEVLRDIPAAFRRGPMASVLDQAGSQGKWREEICRGMKEAVGGGSREWEWVAENFSRDLGNLKYRARYLTALAGAVLYLLMQGLDFLGGGRQVGTTRLIPHVEHGWIEVASGDFNQLIGLGLFLVLLYLSAIQTYHSLRKYLDCAELMRRY